MPSVSGIQISSSTRSGTWAARESARLRGVGRDFHLIALLGQDLLQEPADIRLIVHHQNPRSGHTRSLLCSLLRGSRPVEAARRLAQRQQNAHAGAAGALIIRLNAPAVFFHDFLHDREPQARALGLAGDIRVEHGADQVALEARPVVATR